MGTFSLHTVTVRIGRENADLRLLSLRQEASHSSKHTREKSMPGYRDTVTFLISWQEGLEVASYSHVWSSGIGINPRGICAKRKRLIGKQKSQMECNISQHSL